jgi:hypothetical protein
LPASLKDRTVNRQSSLQDPDQTKNLVKLYSSTLKPHLNHYLVTLSFLVHFKMISWIYARKLYRNQNVNNSAAEE